VLFRIVPDRCGASCAPIVTRTLYPHASGMATPSFCFREFRYFRVFRSFLRPCCHAHSHMLGHGRETFLFAFRFRLNVEGEK
jgi:hypothetical protein